MMRFPFKWISIWALLMVTSCAGQPQKTELPEMPDLNTLLQSATLGAGDVVEVRVYEEKELTGLFRVGSDGRFTYPLVGLVDAGGLTPANLAKLLTTKLRSGYLRDPQVSVFVKEFNSKKVFVLGEVRKPGTFRYEDKMTIVQAITLAGGLKNLAAKDRLILTRVIEGSEQKFVVPFKEISQGRQSNVFLQPGDIVFVPESWL
ncbi:MAG: polysaccharide biosynthesis/export family protein [Myxococcota bacterium]|nr:polysaccharide biosynthesis/export family protein [Myxococcota bacterium]